MKEPSELEKLNAVAQRNHRSPVASAVSSLYFIVYFAFEIFNPHGATWLARGLVVLSLCCVVGFTYQLVRLIRSYWLAKSPKCQSEREQIRQWISQVTGERSPNATIQFNAGDFWTGKVIVRILRQDDWIVVATFYRENLAKAPALTIFDAQSTPLLYSPEQKRVRIGKCKFRKVEFTPESVAPVHQLAQIVATV
jgi:hypothetical protein